MKCHIRHFDETHVLKELKHFLPSQTPLKDFIHHNTLHAFQGMKFYDGIFKAAEIFGYAVTLTLDEYRQLYRNGRINDKILDQVLIMKKQVGHLNEWKERLLSKTYVMNNTARVGALRANWKKQHQLDLDTLVHPILFRILCSYLDQGISIWSFPAVKDGFLASIRTLEKNSYSSFFKTPRAKELLFSEDCSIQKLLKLVVGDESYWEQYLFDQQFCHPGWSGIAAAIEEQPQSLLDQRKITLHDVIMVELLLEIDALDSQLGDEWKPLSDAVEEAPLDLFKEAAPSELREVLNLWQDAFEWSYYDPVLAGLVANNKTKNTLKQNQNQKQATTFQALFCIDERECSMRRHIESVDPHCETLGTPGFFGVEFYFQPENGKFYDKVCPAPVTPKYLVKEYDVKQKRKDEPLYTKHGHGFFSGFLGTFILGTLASHRLLLNVFNPKMSPAISNAFLHMDKESKLIIENTDLAAIENGLQVGFTVEEMTSRAASLLRGIGLTNVFAPMVYVIAHGSSSANNPHHGAHDCGACSGRPGSVNARVFAFMANHPKVRVLLSERGINIPAETQFVGALHDTASDEIEFYDLDILTEVNKANHALNEAAFETALDFNAKERSRRFSSINTKMEIGKVRDAIQKRSVSMFEPRPELGHGTNALCIVGNRNTTKGLFLDRRAFLNSYDYRTDPEGKLLLGIMKPLGPVCGGINLEYYFSRIGNNKLGAGTKLPHNVMGLIGVANSYDGDLRTGLPIQMTEVHDPVRLLIIVEHLPEVVLKTIQHAPDMYEWFINEWVHLAVFNPLTQKASYFSGGSLIEYTPITTQIEELLDVNSMIESSKKMETNSITDATKENLPVYLTRQK